MEKKLRLLLADDDGEDRDFFKHVLYEIDPEVELKSVEDGRQVIDYLSRCGNDGLPCAILLDYNMPAMKAPDILQWICGRAWFNKIHKFVWSTSDQPEHRSGCTINGALNYFVKPANKAGVHEIVRLILQACKMERENVLPGR